MISLARLQFTSIPMVQNYITEKRLDYYISNVSIDGEMYFLLHENRDLLNKQIMVTKLKKDSLKVLLSDVEKECIIQDKLGSEQIRNQIYQHVGITHE